MNVISKKMRGQDKRIHIFQFESREEFRIAIRELKKAAEAFLDKGSENSQNSKWLSVISKLESRASDKFGNETYRLSSCLYEEEADLLMQCFFYLAMSMNHYYETYEKVRGAYDGILSSYEDLLLLMN